MADQLDEALSRVRLMASGCPTWDLSPRDCEALQAVLSRLTTLEQAVATWERIVAKVGNALPASD